MRMHSKFVALIRVELMQIFNSLFSSRRGSKNQGKFAFLVLLVPALLCLYVTGTNTIAMVTELAVADAHLLLVMGVVEACLLVFFLTFYNASGHLFQFKDHDLLMSLPINNTSILLSKVAAFVLFNYYFTFFLLLAPLLGYAYMTQPNGLFYVFALVGSFFVPLIPVVISSILAFAIASISNRFKYRNIATTIVSMVFVLLILYGSMQMGSLIPLLLRSIDSLMLGFHKYLPPLYYYVSAMRQLNFLDLLWSILYSFIPMVLFVLFFAKWFRQINGSLQKITTKKTKQWNMNTLKTSNQWMALFIKEWKRYINTPIYVLNTLIGPIMMIFGTVFLLIKSPIELEQLLMIPNLSSHLHLVLMAAICFLCAMSCTTASTISLEGKQLWIIKSLPIPIRTIFLAKIGLNMALLVPVLTLGVGLLQWKLRFTVIQFIYLIFVIVLAAGFVSILGLRINLMFPRLDWKTEVSVVKQSISVVASMGISAALFGGMAYGYYKWGMGIDPVLGIGALLVVLMVITWGMWLDLNKKGKALFISL